jgi:transposase
MKRYVEGEDRSQATLLPEYLDDYIAEDNAVRAVDAFVEELNLKALGFAGADPALTGRPSYHPAVLLKIYIYGYLNRIPSSRRLEREAQRNVELMWLTGRLAPDFKTIADFRRDNGAGIRNVCGRDEPACPRLQPQARDQAARHGQDDEGDEAAGRLRDLNANCRLLNQRPPQRDQQPRFHTTSAKSGPTAKSLRAAARRCYRRIGDIGAVRRTDFRG